jgi:2-polyprenyl-3-methyl-5-hydroxy-6-metoxy-1,4-benzoquinol methylase
VKFEKLNPPGTFCQLEAIKEMALGCGGKTFLEVGCGDGTLSQVLLESGLQGVGVEMSPPALALAKKQLQKFTAAGQYQLVAGDIMEVDPKPADLVVSSMVLEHIEDDDAFLRRLAGFVNPGGSLIVAVPGRKDHWCLEDDLVGHYRRYERPELSALLTKVGLQNVKVWSASVPTANFLFKLSNILTARTNSERVKAHQSRAEQTQTSGVREIPFKTVFPSFFKLILNRQILYPLLAIQRMFYDTDYGITLVASGKSEL